MRLLLAFLMSLGQSAAGASAPTQNDATTPAIGQGPLTARVAAPADDMVLKAGTEVPMRTVADLSSNSNRQGDRFDLVVSEDVKVGPYVVIAKGSRGVGEITRLVPKGAFGKSGKLEVSLLYVDVGSARIRLDGRTGERGHSGTAGTVVTAVLAGAVSAFVTGTSAKVPEGSTMIGYVDRDLPIVAETATRSPAR